MAGESTDAQTAYIVGYYNGDVTNSPLYKMQDMGHTSDKLYQIFYLEENIESIPVIDVEKPVQKTKSEAIQYLKKLSNENPIITKICDNSSFYPDNMLIALANNPEMACSRIFESK